MREWVKKYFHLIFDLWKYITNFWLAFWRETYRGTKEHRKGLLAFLSLCLIVLVVFVFVGYKFSETPTFCGLCHNMKVYVDSWKASTHNFVNCAQCHYEPGFVNHLKGKWRDGQVSLVMFITGKGPTKPHAEISDGACLQKGCHQKVDLRREMVFKNVAFNHDKHLEELRRGKKLRCTSCHAQIVQGAHLTVTEADCFICHFYKAGLQGEEYCLSCAECGSCHVQPKGDLEVKGVKFNHKKYIERGVLCIECHRGINKGDGAVPGSKCVECHGELELLQTKYPSEYLHRMHVTDHKVECYRCHTEIRHEIDPLPTVADFSGNCKKCHPENVHFGPREMYAGTGGIGVVDTPDKMFLTGIDCTGCHKSQKAGEAALFTTRFTERALGESCVECHGPNTDKMILTWKKILMEVENDLNQRMFEVQSELYRARKNAPGEKNLRRAESLLNGARHNFSFVLLGRGTHNIEYAIKLLNHARNNTEEAMAILRENYRPQEVETRHTCTSLCHDGIEDWSVPFGQSAFPHRPHLADMDCTDCHSTRASHGQTRISACDVCHHGKGVGRVKCLDCHGEVGRVFYGETAIGVEDSPWFKVDVIGCRDCHRRILEGLDSGIEQVKAECVKCHDNAYGEVLSEWCNTADSLVRDLEPRILRMKKEIQDLERKGKHTFVFTKVFGDAEHNFNLLKQGKGAHNLEYAQEVADVTRQMLDQVDKLMVQEGGRPTATR
jgi:nitrate/TMAO reductase-like tetraheme cytochrome c subunit